MATYVNNLRLKEIATGDEDGTWGVSTNTNLELIADALGYDTQDGFSSDANSTTTVGDGVADPARALYFKVTSSATLTATRQLTIAPNTVSRVMWIENATTGGQSITIAQGSGATVTIPTGKTKVIYLDGVGAGAAVVDALAGVQPNVTNATGTLPLANGGTGQTTQTAAFDALSPTTTQGDIIYYNGTDNVRLAKGTAGQALIMNTGATAPSWGAVSGGTF